MCGIAGLIDPNTPPDEATLARMAETMVTRGPDAVGYWTHHAAGLAHRRLSIIDLSEAGRQPLFNEDRSLALVANGEIYGHCELRKDLEARGHRFASGSDSECLLHLYEEYGEKMVERLNGMFAFAIVEVQTGRLFLARDRLGQKPLFYAVKGDRIAFASGPRALATLPWVDRTLDPQAIYDYLEMQYVPGPRTIYCGVRKLLPGHSALWQGQELTLRSYWDPGAARAPFQGSFADGKAALRETMGRAVERRMVADVPLGMFLSGGVDSSVICALGQEASVRPVQTFSLGFPERKYDEREYAAQAAQHLGTDHHFLEVSPDDFSRLPTICADFEEPFADASMLPTWLLSQFTRQHVTVALSGDAADELFAGYYRYAVMKMAQNFNLVPGSLRGPLTAAGLAILPPKREERTFFGRLRRIVEIAGPTDAARYLQLISRFRDAQKGAILGANFADAGLRPTGEWLGSSWNGADGDGLAAMALDMHTYLPNDILVKVDRASMAHGLEVRSPFLDPEVVELALSMPFDWKLNGRTRKHILVESFRDKLPAAIFARGKMGFGVPVARWFRGAWEKPLRDHLLGGQLIREGWLDEAGVQALIDQHVGMKADTSYSLFALLMLELWLAGSEAV